MVSLLLFQNNIYAFYIKDGKELGTIEKEANSAENNKKSLGVLKVPSIIYEDLRTVNADLNNVAEKTMIAIKGIGRKVFEKMAQFLETN